MYVCTREESGLKKKNDPHWYQADKKERRNRNADRTKTEQIDDAENASKKATCLLPPALNEETPPISQDQLISALMS